MYPCDTTLHKTARGAVMAVLSASLPALAQSSPIVDTTWDSPTSTSLQAAGRILNQTGFGPTYNDVYHVEAVGLNGYLNEQLAMPAYQIPLANPLPVTQGDCSTYECTTEYYWWNDILFGHDQLRQRVAFELSKLFVVSVDTVDPRYMPNYLNMLSQDAFGNWYNLMYDVALSPAMGTYLNMANSGAPPAGQQANENFAREFMQLFSIGTIALNQDGSAKLDANGQQIPNYTVAQVQNFALAYTGWTFARPDCSMPSVQQYYWYETPPGQNCPMMAFPGLHSTVQKTLLRGTVLPAGQSAQQDLTAAIKNIFNDPSLPPFVSRRLIQALVKSNPSPAYISRVAAVFINNGAGVRGDMPSILRAILLDPEARAHAVPPYRDPNGGRLRDPILWWSSVMRTMQGNINATLPNVGFFENIFAQWLAGMDETPHDAPSVFGYYSPDYQVQGTNLFGPEFQNENGHTVAIMAQHMEDALNNHFDNINPSDTEFTLNLGPGSLWYATASQNSTTDLVQVLDALLMHGTMTQDMFQAIVNAVSLDSPQVRVESAVYLIVTSPQYRMQM